MKLKQKEIAAKLGISERTLRRWKHAGKEPPTCLCNPCWCGATALLTITGRAVLLGTDDDGVAYEGICLACGAYTNMVVPIYREDNQ